MTKKFIKKPVVIEAMQFTDASKDKVFAWASSINQGTYPAFDNNKPVLRIPTLEGEMTASLGDYVIMGVKGELYPCKPDIFEQSYMEVTE